MSALYTTKVSASGGRRGQIHSEDGLLDIKLALPRQLGGKGDATNPETLFAGGYAACFENAILHISRDAGLRFADEDIGVIDLSMAPDSEAAGTKLCEELSLLGEIEPQLVKNAKYVIVEESLC